MLRDQAGDSRYTAEASGDMPLSPVAVASLQEEGLGSHDSVFTGERITMDQATHGDTRYHRMKAA